MPRLLKRPGFTLVAVLSLALGIGANTAVFSFLNTLLLTKLPVRDPDSLYQLVVTHRTFSGNSFSYSNVDKLCSSFDFFQEVVAWFHHDFDVQIDQTPLRAHGAVVSGKLLSFPWSEGGRRPPHRSRGRQCGGG